VYLYFGISFSIGGAIWTTLVALFLFPKQLQQLQLSPQQSQLQLKQPQHLESEPLSDLQQLILFPIIN
jgi:hypothetical protein